MRHATFALATCAALAGCGGEPESPKLAASTDVEQCLLDLRAIHDGLEAYAAEHGGLPEQRGARLLATLIASGTWENTAENARRLTCPGVPVEELALAGRAPTEWFASLDGLGGDHTAYAARDMVAHPLPTFPTGGGEALVACDNALGANHGAGLTNVLFADGSVVTYELEREIAAGRLPSDADRVPVGPDAPDALAALRVLSLD